RVSRNVNSRPGSSSRQKRSSPSRSESVAIQHSEPGIRNSRWWTLGRGDVDTLVAQLGLNLAQAIIPVVLLAPVGIPVAFSVTHLVPGYALGFLVGSAGLVA